MLSYNGKKIIPAPFVELSKVYSVSPDGSKLGTTYNISLAGTLLPFRGSPSGHYASLETAFWDLGGYPPDEPNQADNEDFNAILRKQEAIRWLFSQDGKSLEWQPAEGQPVVKCNPRVVDVNFPQGTWADRSEYTIRLEADLVYINGTTSIEDGPIGSGFINSAEDRWEFSEQEGFNGQRFNATHTISANGIKGFDENGNLFGGREAWEHAKVWVEAHASGVVNPQALFTATGSSGWIGGSYTRSPSIDKTNGSYALTERWIVQPTNTVTESSFDVNYNPTTDEYACRYELTIHGLGDGKRSGAPEAISAAIASIPSTDQARTTLLNQVGSILEGKTLAASPETRNVGISQREGTVRVTYEFSTSDSSSVISHYTATINYNESEGRYVITLNGDLAGKGVTRTVRLNNVRSAILSDASALTRAIQILGTQIPGGINFASSPRSKSSSINERAATASVSWTFDSGEDNNLEVSVTSNRPSAVTAIIPIPGREDGPIIQDMSTKTEYTVVVSVRSQGHASRPNADQMLNLANLYSGLTAGSYLVTGDTENWNPIRKTYSREVRYLVKG